MNSRLFIYAQSAHKLKFERRVGSSKTLNPWHIRWCDGAVPRRIKCETQDGYVIAYCWARNPPKLPPHTIQGLSTPRKCFRSPSMSSTIWWKVKGSVRELWPCPRKSKESTRYEEDSGEYALKSDLWSPVTVERQTSQWSFEINLAAVDVMETHQTLGRHAEWLSTVHSQVRLSGMLTERYW